MVERDPKLETLNSKLRFHSRLPIDFDFQIADELIEREIDLVRLSYSNHETKLHQILCC